MNSTSRFDKAAAQWDQNPTRVELARAVGVAIGRGIDLQPAWRVLDYGAGTGLLTLCLQPSVASVTALDTSKGMAEALSGKLNVADIRNVEVRLWDLVREPYPEGDFDLVVSSMTMHHIQNVPLVFGRMVEVLKPGGYLAVADLDTEDGGFHGEMEGVFHKGFARPEVLDWLSRAGLIETAIHDAHRMSKLDAAGELRSYGIFLAVGRKPHAR